MEELSWLTVIVEIVFDMQILVVDLGPYKGIRTREEEPMIDTNSMEIACSLE